LVITSWWVRAHSSAGAYWRLQQRPGTCKQLCKSSGGDDDGIVSSCSVPWAATRRGVTLLYRGGGGAWTTTRATYPMRCVAHLDGNCWCWCWCWCWKLYGAFRACP